MELSLNSFFRYIVHGKDTYENERMINRTVYEETMGEMRLGAVIGALFQIYLFWLSTSRSRYYGGLLMWYRLMYVILFLLCICSLMILSYTKKDLDNRLDSLTWIAPVVAFLILSGAVCASCLDSFSAGFADPSAFMIVVLVIPLAIYMHPLSYVAVSFLTDGAMLIAYSIIRSRLSSGSVAIPPLILYFILTIAIGLMVFFMQFSFRENRLRNDRQQMEIKELSNAQNRFFSSMSHEIRTPINTIIGLNEMILREKVSDEVAEDAANIRAAGNLLLHLINDILDMSKISSGQMKLTPVAYRPGDMLSEIVGMLWLRSKEKGLDFHVEVAPDIPSELYGDEVRIKQILINVLNNAIKYTKKGSVTLSIQCNGIKDKTANIVYSVTDTGMGIRKENIPYLFTAFKRVDEEGNRHIEGTGLGLSIVKQLVEMMGGSVTVNSIYTQGSTFVIEIPQPVIDDSAIGNINLEQKHKANTSGSYRASFEAEDAHVLVVDDNESNILVIRKLLRDTKVKLDTASSGAEALELTLEGSYDVILMDHMMPEMDGIECFHRIKEQVGGLSKNAKIVALTANAGSENRKLYSNEGFDGYIVKPVNSRELETELIRLLPSNIVTILHDDTDIVENSMSWMDSKTIKKPVTVTTESVADIPRSLLEEYGIRVIPHKVETENGIFADGNEIDSDGMLEYMMDGNNVKTHAPSVKEHETFFADALSRANNVIHVTISSKVRHSGYEAAGEGAAAFDNVTVFDSGHLSSGQGIIAIQACNLAAAGLSVGEILHEISGMRNSIHSSFIVDNLDYLARSGQIGKRSASACKAIMLHPVIDMINGRMKIHRFYFGSRTHAWARYAASTLSNVSNIDRSMLFITYVGLNKKELDLIKTLVEKRIRFDNVYYQKASPAIAVNSGPGTFGLLFKRKQD